MDVPEETKSEIIPEEGEDSKAAAATSDDASADDKPNKKRTWKKPKDKPKRPLSAYNIFFQHQRSRIVEGQNEPATPEEIVRSIEGILYKSREKRRHRKTHGRISFGDLARAIAESWKNIDPKSKAIFDHYAEVDMMRYRREIKAWKDKKEMEEEAHAMAKHASFMNRMNASFSSVDSSDTNFDSLPDESVRSEPWNRSRTGIMNEAFNNSFSSVDSGASEFSYEPEPLQQTIINRQQEILQQQLRESNPSFMGMTIPSQRPGAGPNLDMMQSSFSSLQGGNFQTGNQNMQSFGHSSFNDMHSARVGMNNWNSSVGHSSMNSLQPTDSLFTPSNHGPSNHVSDYSGSHSNMSFNFSGHTSGMNSSFSSGFHPSDGLVPPSTNFNQLGHNSFSDMRFSNQQAAGNNRKQGGNGGSSGLLGNYMDGGMDIDQRSFHR